MNQLDLTLEEVEQEFSNWRYNRSGNESIPNYLWEQVKILLTTYRRGELMQRLKLTTQQFKDKGLLSIKQDEDPEITHSFIQIPSLPSTVDSITQKITSLTIQRGDTQMCLNHPSDEQIQLIINTLLR